MNQHVKAQADRPARHDPYHAVHKGLRHRHGVLLSALGSTDWRDEAATDAVLERLKQHMAMCADHLAHEDREIHAAVEARKPGASHDASDDHAAHERSFGELQSLISLTAAAAGEQRMAAGNRLYRRFALFVADDLRHMEEEEGTLLALLHNAFSDDELRAIEGRIVASIAPAMMIEYLLAILAALNPAERDAMLAGMRAGMPGDAFEAMMASLAAAGWSPDRA